MEVLKSINFLCILKNSFTPIPSSISLSSSLYLSIPTTNIILKYLSVTIFDATVKGVSRTPATAKMEIKVNGHKLT